MPLLWGRVHLMSDDVQDILLEREVSGRCSFHGRFTHSLDNKRRLTIPSSWRAMVDSPKCLYVLPDFSEPYLRVFPGVEWARRLDRIRELPIADEQARDFVRRIGMSSEILVWDSQGRIRVSDELLAFAGLEDQVILAGAVDTFELWSPENIGDKLEINLSGIREKAKEYGF